jgi:hypothetical protein
VAASSGPIPKAPGSAGGYLLEKLMGSTMMVRGAAGEIAKLTGPEPEEVFEAIRGRILQDDNQLRSSIKAVG